MKTSRQWIDDIQEKAVVRRRAQIKKRRTAFGVSAFGTVLSGLLALLLLIRPFFPEIQPPKPAETDAAGSETLSAPADTGAKVPRWYKPGGLTVTALLSRPAERTDTAARKGAAAVTPPLWLTLKSQAPTEQSTAEHGSYVVLPDNAAMKDEAPRDADYVKMESLPEYPNGEGIYFHVPENKAICFSSIIQKKAEANGLFNTGDKIDLHYDDPLYGNSIFNIRTVGGESDGPYFCNIYDGRFMAFPIDPMQTHGLEEPGGAKRQYMALWGDGADRQGEIHLIDMSSITLETVNISDNANARLDVYGAPRFSDGGGYVFYVYGENGTAYDEDKVPNTAVYNIQTKTTVCIKGTVERFIDGDKKVIVITKDGGAVMDCETGRDVTSETVPEDWQKYRVRVYYEKDYSKGARQTADLVSLFSGAPDEVLVQHAGAVLPSDEYVYVYMTGDPFILCRKTAGGESFKVPLDESFIRDVAAAIAENKSVSFYLTISGDKTKLLLSAFISPVTSEAEQTAEFSAEEIGRLFRGASCLEDLKEYIDAGKTFNPYIAFGNGPAMFNELGTLCAVEGNGYTALIIFSTAFPYAFVAVEDYRDRTFCLYAPFEYTAPSSRPPWLIPPELYDGGWEDVTLGTKPYRKSLADTADQEKTLALLSGVKRIDPYYDYADFYTDGALSKEKAEKWLLREEQAYAAGTIWLNDYSTIEIMEHAWTMYNGEIGDRETTALLLSKLSDVTGYFPEGQGNRLGFPHSGDPQNDTGELAYGFQFFETKYPEQMDCMCELQIGRLKNGKYFIYTYAGYAYIGAELYGELTALCAQLYSSAKLT